MSTARLDKTALFGRLAAERGVTVVTPNARLAQELGREFDQFQLARGLDLWDAPDLLPITAFVSRAYEDALYSGSPAELPLLLAPAEEQALWESVLERSEERDRLLALAETAAAARDAWKTAHAWRLLEKMRPVPANEDAQAFLRWAQRYERATKQAGHTDAARLPDVVRSVLGEAGVAKPQTLVAYGFDIVTAQQQALFDAFAASGTLVATCEPARRESHARRIECLDARDEIGLAARWARQRLEASGQAPVRIGVVVPDLAARRNALRRVFSQTMCTAGAATQPFNLSLGEPLTAYPLVDAAFNLLELAGRMTAFERASQLVRSPFIAAAESEMVARARLDALLRRRAEPELTLDRLVGLVRAQASRVEAPVLLGKLEALAGFRKARLFAAQSPGDWGRAFSEALALAGFPGERSLDSNEYQTLKKWHDVLAQFARLERVVPRLGFGEALSRLRRLAAETAFQPESPDVPIQILGVLESAGCEFDHLWVMGLSVEAWPLAARPNPFLPIALQRDAGIPEASSQASLDLDVRITQGWLGAAPEVVFSHPSKEADRSLDPSPLILPVEAGALSLPPFESRAAAIHASRKLERIDDRTAPPVGTLVRRGGSGLLRDQAACPFRAFALHRLGAEALEAPHAGLDALERGALVHQVLASVWRELETKHGLDTIGESDLQKRLDRAADEAVARQKRDRPTTLAGRFAQIEKRRLARLAREWLELERGRGDFSVFATEAERTIDVGGLRLKGRLDRVDETADGNRIVIDYKVSAPGAGAWLGERPDEPQLPLYLTAAEPSARAIAFAQVRAGDMKLVALAAEDGILPNARTLPYPRLKRAAESWGEQVEAWRAELERLAQAFVQGDAQVDPKLRACDYCDQKPFCRIGERDAQDDAEAEA